MSAADELYADDMLELGKGGRDEVRHPCQCSVCGAWHESSLHDGTGIDFPTYGVFDTTDDLIAGPYAAVQDAQDAYRTLLAYGHHARHLTVGLIQ